jgi:hypothetical protein
MDPGGGPGAPTAAGMDPGLGIVVDKGQ